MSTPAVCILRTGLVTAVGLSAPACCAAFRAKLTNPTQTRFQGASGEWLMAHEVPLSPPLRGIPRLASMAAMAIDEALADLPRDQWGRLPVILCVAEAERPGRLAGLDDELFLQVQEALGVVFSPRSAIVAQGRVGVAVALAHARALMADAGVRRVLVAATDSLLSWPTLSHYAQQRRLLTDDNVDGFMPGEAAGALLLGPPQGRAGELLCSGIGFGLEAAGIESEAPLRAEGLAQAIQAALADAGCQMHHMDFRITDNTGEQYYFKEASLALSRTLRVRKPEFDLWHPGECTGEIGAASGAAIVAAALAACDKQYACGPNILAHLANDAGQRAALCLQYTVPA
jgi:3-oxoacyl-[acyl-carrier-protein] synthase-1